MILVDLINSLDLRRVVVLRHLEVQACILCLAVAQEVQEHFFSHLALAEQRKVQILTLMIFSKCFFQEDLWEVQEAVKKNQICFKICLEVAIEVA
jgi:hypothetical protein